jgi:menaquinol-cytochrome c reductase iron-sulfur subunit
MSDRIGTTPPEIPRRSMLGMFVAAATWVGALLAIPLTRFALFPLRRVSAQAGWSDLGPVETFLSSKSPIVKPLSIERKDGWNVTTNQQSVYVIAAKPGESPRVLSAVCPHLGCTVQWSQDRDQFNCPCHGGEYTADGSRLAGPPNRGMDELPARVQDGRLYVQFHSYRQLQATKEVLD